MEHKDMEKGELNAMISLLEDNDSEIVNAVRESFLDRGEDIIPELERAWEAAVDEKTQEKLENLIQTIQFAGVKEELRLWIQTGAANILEGAFHVARFNFPHIRYADIDLAVEAIRKDVWLEINDNLTALEKIKILNYIVFQVHHFGNNASGIYTPQDSYINRVIETKKGNPVSLAIVYLAVTWKLGLPVFGVNLPGNFILAYKDEHRYVNAPDPAEDVLFYINPYGKGAVLGRQEIDYYIEQQKLEPQPSFFKPCANRDIIARLVRHLLDSYEKLRNLHKIQRLQELLDMTKDIEIS